MLGMNKSIKMVSGGRFLRLVTNSEFVIGLQKLHPSFTGNAIEIRRDSDSAKQEFEFSNGILPQTDILTFVGVGSGYISAIYEQKTKTKINITTEAQQKKIVNSGTWVSYTTKYNLEIPQNTALTISNIAAVNRMFNLGASCFIGYKGSYPVSSYNADYVYPIKCKAGLMDFSITNGTNVFWYDADGNTSTASRPAVTLTNAGNSYLFATNMTANNIVINDYNTDTTTVKNYIGEVKDLPRLTGNLILEHANLMTGNISELPNLTLLDVTNCNGLTGTFNDFKPYKSFSANYHSTRTGSYTPAANCESLILHHNAGMSASNIDQTLINCANIITTTGKNMYVDNRRTSASDTAINYLRTTLGWTVNEVAP